MITMLKAKNHNSDVLNTFSTLHDTPFDCTWLQKSAILAEQLIFARYLTLTDPRNQDFSFFMTDVERAVDEHTAMTYTDSKHMGVESSIYTKYRNYLDSCTSDGTPVSDVQFGTLKTILDDPRVHMKDRQLPIKFVEVFLQHLSGVEPTESELFFRQGEELGRTVINPTLIYPSLYHDAGHVYATYSTESFMNYVYNYKSKPGIHPINDTNNPIMGFLEKFAWTGYTMEEVCSIFGALHVGTSMAQGMEGYKTSVPAFIDKLAWTSVNNPTVKLDSSLACTSLFSFIRTVHAKYGMDLHDTTIVGRVLSKVSGYHPLVAEYLMANKPTLAQFEAFSGQENLAFLREFIEQPKGMHSMVGYGGVEAKDDEDTLKEDEPSSEDTADDKDKAKEDDDTTDEANDFSDLGLGDTDEDGDDTSGTDDTGGSDTSTSSVGGDSSATGAGTGDAFSETDTQSDDPNAIVYNVMRMDPSISTIIYRLKTEKLLKKILDNPPAVLNNRKLRALETWTTEWLFIVAPSTTKRFLSSVLSDVDV